MGIAISLNIPKGLSDFGKSVSPDLAKNWNSLCSLCLCGEKNTFCSNLVRSVGKSGAFKRIQRLGPVDDTQFRKILDYFSFSWKGYKKVRKGAKKRILRHMQSLNCRRVSEYLDLIDANPNLRQESERVMAVSISRFFRDRDLWRILEEEILPKLAGSGIPVIRAWSAGCAGGEEVYSLKIIHERLVQAKTCNALIQVLATDVNPENLDRARAGIFPVSSLREVPHDARDRFFDTARRRQYAVKHELTANIQWQCHHLLSDPPDTGFHLLFLRNNLLTYYRDNLKIPAFQRIAGTLSSSGYLIIGAHEKLPDSGFRFVRHPRNPHIFQIKFS